ncbi:MAG: hypothetical protein L6R39_005172 [Caloplaca ligustica]|nr:MAG: hypothetical protein L6R39_005172 [Caloplaca ligustica]
MHSKPCLQAPPKLLTLPGEIRNRIYELLLLSPKEYVNPYLSRFRKGSNLFLATDVPRSHERHEWSFATGIHSRILTTCKTIAFEASPILYAENFFELRLSDASHFTQTIGPRNANLLRDVAIAENGIYQIPNEIRWERAFRYCSGMKRLHCCFEFVIDPDEDEGQEYRHSVFLFFKRAQWLLKVHPTLKLAMSPYATGRCRIHTHFKSLCVSLIATKEDYGWEYLNDDAATVLDMNRSLNELRERIGLPVRKRKLVDHHKKP